LRQDAALPLGRRRCLLFYFHVSQACEQREALTRLESWEFRARVRPDVAQEQTVQGQRTAGSSIAITACARPGVGVGGV
jgi:hypothetical protein